MLETAILIGLASWRMANLLVYEDGPYSIFSRIRQHASAPGKMTRLRFEVSLALECIMCTSVWTTLLAIGLWFLEPWIIIGLAAMAIATFPRYLDKEA